MRSPADTPAEGFIEATPASRRRLSAWLAIGMAAAAALQFWLLPMLFSFVNLLPFCERLRWLRGILWSTLGALPLFGLWAAWYARKLLRAGQWPLPDARVWRRTRILTGRSVTWRACALFAWAGMAVAAPLLGAHFLGRAGLLSEPRQCISVPSSAR